MLNFDSELICEFKFEYPCDRESKNMISDILCFFSTTLNDPNIMSRRKIIDFFLSS